MNIRILMLGKNKDDYIGEGMADFARKIFPFCSLEYVYLKDERVHEDIAKVLEKEAEKILCSFLSDEFIIVLDDAGKSFTTEKLAEYFSSLTDRGTGKIAFVIGSSHGFSEKIIKKAHLVLSLSPLTMNHQIVRLVLLEQLYRVFTIQRGMKYHK